MAGLRGVKYLFFCQKSLSEKIQKLLGLRKKDVVFRDCICWKLDAILNKFCTLLQLRIAVKLRGWGEPKQKQLSDDTQIDIQP